MKKLLGPLIILFIVFFHTYQQALPVFGSSFILASGALGLGLYLYNGRPFPEIMTIVAAYMPFVIASFVSGYMTNGVDDYLSAYTRSQLAWLFSGYLIVFLFFYVYPKGSYILFLSYMVIPIFIQGIISIAMYQDPAINDFFLSIQMADAMALYKRELTEGERLLGFGTAFFGAGIVYGTALLFIVYIVIKKKSNLIITALWGVIYSFIFFVGILSARTTLVGFGCSVIYAALFLVFNKSNRGQFIRFMAITAGCASIGYTLCYVYFPEFSDWAFEAFINYQESGEFRTHSSDGLENMFILPRTYDEWMFGWGTMTFFGLDVGYVRLLFYGGLPATIAFFFFQLALAWIAFTKDIGQNLMMLMLVVYSLALNLKGLADLNQFMYPIIFYLWYYKYFVYTPQLYKLGKFNSTKLRYAVQSPSSGRRVQSNV